MGSIGTHWWYRCCLAAVLASRCTQPRAPYATRTAAQERTYKRFYGLLAQRFCYYNRAYMERFDECFRNQYAIIHR